VHFLSTEIRQMFFKILKNGLENLKRWCHNHLFSFIPEPKVEDDEEYTLVHQVINLCPNCGICNCVLEQPLGYVTQTKLFEYSDLRYFRYLCVRCNWHSRTYKERT